MKYIQKSAEPTSLSTWKIKQGAKIPTWKSFGRTVVKGQLLETLLKEQGYIEVAALAYMRGWNVDNTILVFEEAQNATPAQIKLLLTRIGFNSKFFLSGDLEQSDKFKDKTKSGLYDAKRRLHDLKGVGIFEFGNEDIVRNPIIGRILNRYD
jgi:phosphate starvation-inducible PhoH-like protein